MIWSLLASPPTLPSPPPCLSFSSSSYSFSALLSVPGHFVRCSRSLERLSCSAVHAQGHLGPQLKCQSFPQEGLLWASQGQGFCVWFFFSIFFIPLRIKLSCIWVVDLCISPPWSCKLLFSCPSYGLLTHGFVPGSGSVLDMYLLNR